MFTADKIIGTPVEMELGKVVGFLSKAVAQQETFRLVVSVYGELEGVSWEE